MKKNARVYISGKMDGEPNYNKEKFDAAESLLKQYGYKVFNPAKLIGKHKTRKEYMRKDIEELLKCDGVALIPGWTYSRGAKLEVDICVELGIPFWEIKV